MLRGKFHYHPVLGKDTKNNYVTRLQNSGGKGAGSAQASDPRVRPLPPLVLGFPGNGLITVLTSVGVSADVWELCLFYLTVFYTTQLKNHSYVI